MNSTLMPSTINKRGSESAETEGCHKTDECSHLMQYILIRVQMSELEYGGM